MKVVGAGPFPFVLPAKERHPAPECGTTVWCVGAGIHGGSPSSYRRKVVVPHPDAGPVSTRLFVLPVKTGIHGGVTVGGCVPTSSRFLVQGAPSRPYPTMGTASECGTTVWCVRAGIHGDPSIRLTGENRYPWWGDSGGYALTPSRSVFEGAPSRPYPTMGTRIGVRYDCVVCRSRNTWWLPLVLPAKGRRTTPRCGAGIHTPLRLTGENRYPWWGDSGGVRTYVEPVLSPRCAQPPLPHHGYRIGVRYDGVVCRGRNTWWPPPRLTGENRYPVRPYPEPVRSRRCAQPPLPHHGYRIGVRYDDYLPSSYR